MDGVKIFTTPILDGIKIAEYKGLVTARTVRAVNIIRDFFTSFRDVFGGRSQSYQTVMSEMQAEVIREIQTQAHNIGANAIVGFTIDFENIGAKGKSLLMAFAKGTAVVIEEKS